MSADFSQKFLEEMSSVLSEEETRLARELAEFSSKDEHNKDNFDANFPQMGDKEDENAAEVAVYSDNLTLERELEKALRDTRAALLSLKKGDYGFCKYCKNPIDERRLRARPASSACVNCKKLLTQEI